MKTYKPVELQFYNKLMEIYRCHYRQEIGESVDSIVPEARIDIQKGTGQQSNRVDYWTTFEKAIEAVRKKKYKRRSGRK